jgi:hypothetical protein
MSLISIILFFVGIIAFIDNKKHVSLIIILTLSSSYFLLAPQNFLIGTLSLQHGDLALLLIIILTLISYRGTNSELNGIKKGFLFFLIFLIISVTYDFVVRDTSAMQIFRTTRKIGYLLFFFLINSFSWNDYKKVIKIVFIITVIHSILYISQYVLDFSYESFLNPSKEKIENKLGGLRHTHRPTYIIPILIIILYLYDKSKSKFHLMLIVLFSSAIILTQSRGLILSGVSIFLLYLILKNRVTVITLFSFTVIFILIYITLQTYFPIIGERFSGFYQEITLIRDMDTNNLTSFFHEGSSVFRFGITYERVIYVLQDPIRILLGVGFIPDMDIIEPIFILGTHSPTLPTGFEQYNSIDIFLPNIITRYGIVGSLIYIYFIFKLVTFAKDNIRCIWGAVLYIYLLSLIVVSFSGESFYNTQSFIFIFILIGLLLNEKDNKKKNYKIPQDI